MLENVLNLAQSKHKKDFFNWIKKLKNMGYKTIWGKLDSNDFGLLQSRKRIFALSIYDPNNNIDWEERNDFSEVLKEIYKNNEYKPKWIQTHNIEGVFDFKNKYKEESSFSLMKNTPSRIKMVELGRLITPNNANRIAAVTTKQDRWPNVGYLNYKNNKKDKNGVDYLNKRFITPREAYRLMGFNDKYYERAHKKMNEICVSKVSARDKLYKQAGNSIAINVLEMIFYYIQRGEF